MGKRDTASCYHCASLDDTLEHTVEECPAWDTVRFDLARKLGLRNSDRITLIIIVGKILQKRENWQAFSCFALSVIKSKEEEERRRERASLSMPSNPELQTS